MHYKLGKIFKPYCSETGDAMNEPVRIEPLILTLRGQKVILDADLAGLYGVQTKVLNQAVKRNADRFPEDLMFQLTALEWRNLKSQIVTSSLQPTEEEEVGSLRSQFVTLKTGRGNHRKYMPFAFTEHGALMAAMVLNSPEAVAMSLFVIRAFVRMREQLAANAAILKRLAEIDKTLLEHDQALGLIWEQLQPLLAPPPDPPKRRIGFHQD
jgi:phage regulator Rha-like protein